MPNRSRLNSAFWTACHRTRVLIWLPQSRVTAEDYSRWFCSSRWYPEPQEETEPVIATVDHADIRGLITTLLVSVGHLPRSRDEHLFQAPNVFEGCANTGAASLPVARVYLL